MQPIARLQPQLRVIWKHIHIYIYMYLYMWIKALTYVHTWSSIVWQSSMCSCSCHLTGVLVPLCTRVIRRVFAWNLHAAQQVGRRNEPLPVSQPNKANTSWNKRHYRYHVATVPHRTTGVTRKWLSLFRSTSTMLHATHATHATRVICQRAGMEWAAQTCVIIKMCACNTTLTHAHT